MFDNAPRPPQSCRIAEIARARAVIANGRSDRTLSSSPLYVPVGRLDNKAKRVASGGRVDAGNLTLIVDAEEARTPRAFENVGRPTFLLALDPIRSGGRAEDKTLRRRMR